MADTKKKETAVKKPNRLVKWFKETRGELRKVTWPTREEALRMTKIVVIVVLAMAIFLGLIDSAFSKLVSLVIG